jgi:hypothetical protein
MPDIAVRSWSDMWAGRWTVVLPAVQRGPAIVSALPCRHPGCPQRRTPRPLSTADTAAAGGVRLAAELDTAAVSAVRRCFRNRGRCPDGQCPPQALRTAGLQDAVAGRRPLEGAATAGRPGRAGGRADRRPGAPVGHRRPLQGQGLLDGQPAQPQAQQVAALPAGHHRAGGRLGSIPTLAQVSVGQARSSTVRSARNTSSPGRPVRVPGHQLVQQRPVWLWNARVQQRGRGDQPAPYLPVAG